MKIYPEAVADAATEVLQDWFTGYTEITDGTDNEIQVYVRSIAPGTYEIFTNDKSLSLGTFAVYVTVRRVPDAGDA